MSSRTATVCVALAALNGVSLADDRFSEPGELEPNSGQGVKDAAVLLPGIRFPLESAPAYANSQVYRKGGNHSPAPGGQCDPANYSYPWRDNFCEKREWTVAYCPSGKGHQGQDIRPATCKANLHYAVAAEDGIIAQIGTYSVTLQTKGGTLYRYMHMKMSELSVKELDQVKRGERLGKVSNDFGNSSTTIHLHFDVKDTIVLNGQRVITYIPPYPNLVEAYKKLLAGKP